MLSRLGSRSTAFRSNWLLREFERFSRCAQGRQRLPKRLAILRHAKSDWGHSGLSDFERPLNERGRDAAETMRRELVRRHLSFDVILSSPSTRTRETLDRIGLAGRTRWIEEIYLASAATLLIIVRSLPEDAESALIVGHNPGLQEIVLSLARVDPEGLRKRVLAKYPTAALALLDLDIESWSSAEPGCGSITELLLPRELA